MFYPGQRSGETRAYPRNTVHKARIYTLEWTPVHVAVCFIQIFWCRIINWFLLLCIEDRGGVYRRAPGSTAVEWSGHFGPAAWSACVSIRKIQTPCKVRTNLVFELVLDYSVPWSVLQGTVMPYGQMSQVLELLLGSFQCCVYSVFFSLVKWVTDPEMLCFTSLLY